MQDFSGKRITVMGLGLHGGGLAVATWFLRHGARVTVTDLKTRRDLAPSVAALKRVARERGSGTLYFVLGQHRAQDFRDADLVIQNPGVPRESKPLAIARAAHVPIENEASLFLKLVRSLTPHDSRLTTIGVTGTRGKSTTAALIHAMLRQAGRTVFLAGNIRIPMFGILDRVIAAARRGPVDVVLELSSWHCERLSVATGGPDVAVLTNLYPDHLNRYSSMRSYAAAKARLVRFQDRRGIVIANAEQPIIRAMAKCSPGRAVWFSRRRADATAIRLRALLPLLGEHNTMNALAAYTAARACGTPLHAIREALRQFRGLPGRLETIARHRGVTYVNDTCATSPDGVIAALRALRGRELRRESRIMGPLQKSLSSRESQISKRKIANATMFTSRVSGGAVAILQPKFVTRSRNGLLQRSLKNQESRIRSIVLIAGGTDKGLDFNIWAKEVAESVKAIVFLPGTATKKMKRALQPFVIRHSSFVIRDARSMRDAVQHAAAYAHRDDIVLLSPGAASFGLFQHEFDRGDQFVKAIRT